MRLKDKLNKKISLVFKKEFDNEKLKIVNKLILKTNDINHLMTLLQLKEDILSDNLKNEKSYLLKE